jgi:endonuclease/exonuclease/phosphatase family metal-dependent hydrolase
MSAIKVVCFNIQFGFGIDRRYELDRTINAVRGADIIALQEVTRGFVRNGGVDMVEDIRVLLSDCHCAVGMPFSIDFGSRLVDGRMRDQRFEFGNLVLSRWPIMASRNHLLPRRPRTDRLNLQRGALEALIATPTGAIRFISAHLDHVDASERLDQIDALRGISLGETFSGGAASGLGEFGFPELPQTDDVLVMGDFNMFPRTADYQAMCGDGALVDVSPPGEVMSFYDPQYNDAALQRLDYGFANPALAERVIASRIDEASVASDHRPVWFEISA